MPDRNDPAARTVRRQATRSARRRRRCGARRRPRRSYTGWGLAARKARRLPGPASRLAQLDPLVHGEVAAFGLSKPARAAPDLTFNGPDGEPVTLASFKGKTLLVNLWATWCIPCRKEMPALDKLKGSWAAPTSRSSPSTSTRRGSTAPRPFLKDTGVEHSASYRRPQRRRAPALKSEGQLLGLPTTLLIDRNGCELGTMAGPAEWASPEADNWSPRRKASRDRRWRGTARLRDRSRSGRSRPP